MLTRITTVLTALVAGLFFSATLSAQGNAKENGIPGLEADVAALQSVNDAQDVAIQAIIDQLDSLGGGSGFSMVRRPTLPQVVSVDCNDGDDLQQAIDEAQVGFVRIEIAAGTCTGNFVITRDGIELRGQGQGATTIDGSVSLDSARSSRLQSLRVTSDGVALNMTNYSTVLLVNVGLESSGISAAETVWAASSRILAGFGSNITMNTASDFGRGVSLFSGGILVYLGGGLTVDASAVATAVGVSLVNGSQLVTNNSNAVPLTISAAGGSQSDGIRVGRNALFNQLVLGPIHVAGDIVSDHGSIAVGDLHQQGSLRLFNNTTLSVFPGGTVTTDSVSANNLTQLSVGGLLQFNAGGGVEAFSNSMIVGHANGRVDGDVTLFQGTRMSLVDQSSALSVTDNSNEIGALFVASGASVGPLVP